MNRRGLFGLLSAGVASPVLAAVPAPRPFDLDREITEAHYKINQWIERTFGDLVEVAQFKRAVSEYGIAHMMFTDTKAAKPGVSDQLADEMISWISWGLLNRKPKPNQTLVWRVAPEFEVYEGATRATDLIRIRARGHVFVPGPASDMSRDWPVKLWMERHPGKITVAPRANIV